MAAVHGSPRYVASIHPWVELDKKFGSRNGAALAANAPKSVWWCTGAGFFKGREIRELQFMLPILHAIFREERTPIISRILQLKARLPVYVRDGRSFGLCCQVRHGVANKSGSVEVQRGPERSGQLVFQKQPVQSVELAHKLNGPLRDQGVRRHGSPRPVSW